MSWIGYTHSCTVALVTAPTPHLDNRVWQLLGRVLCAVQVQLLDCLLADDGLAAGALIVGNKSSRRARSGCEKGQAEQRLMERQERRLNLSLCHGAPCIAAGAASREGSGQPTRKKRHARKQGSTAWHRCNVRCPRRQAAHHEEGCSQHKHADVDGHGSQHCTQSNPHPAGSRIELCDTLYPIKIMDASKRQQGVQRGLRTPTGAATPAPSRPAGLFDSPVVVGAKAAEDQHSLPQCEARGGVVGIRDGPGGASELVDGQGLGDVRPAVNHKGRAMSAQHSTRKPASASAGSKTAGTRQTAE